MNKLPEQQTLTIQQALDLGVEHHNAGRLAEAESVYQKILRAAPNQPVALRLLGTVAHQLGNNEAAVDLVTKAIAVNPNDAEAHNNMGNALRRLGRVEEAVSSFRKAVSLMPDFAGAYSNLGLTLRQLGDFTGAAEEFRKALRLAPNLAEAWSGLARTGRLTFREDEAVQAEAVLTAGTLSRSDRRHLHYALGKYYDDTEAWDQAFLHFTSANNLRDIAATADGPVALMASMVQAAAEVDGSQTHQIKPAPGDPVPVFIFGMPRSGTTLAEQILASHPLVEAGGELNIIEATLSRIAPGFRDGKAPKPSDITKEMLAEVRRRFFDCFPEGNTERRYLTDKSLFNFIHFPVLRQAFPDGKFVHCRRDPLDTCLSIYFTDFKQDRAFTTDLESIGTVYRAYRDTVERWRQSDPGCFHEFDYEAVLDDQETEIRHLLDGCGLPWESACLQFFETKRQVATPSDWQVRLPIFSTSRGRWRHYEKSLAPLIKALDS